MRRHVGTVQGGRDLSKRLPPPTLFEEACLNVQIHLLTELNQSASAAAHTAAGFQLYIPTGKDERGGSDNIGKGMWTYEPFLGTTVYFDEKRTVSLATTAFWEFHGKKKDTDVKVGQILTLEGGLGKSFLGGGLIRRGGVLRPVEAYEGSVGRLHPPGRKRARRGFPRQAQGVRLRAGRDAAGREQVEALFTGQHPLPLGNRRAPENTGADAGRHGDLPHSQREAAMSGGVVKTTRIVAAAILTCLAVSGLAVAQLAFTKPQVADRIRKVEDGVDEFRKWSEKRAEQGRTNAQSAQASGRARGRTGTESQKAAAHEKKDDLDDALSDLNKSTNRLRRKFDPHRQVDGNAATGGKGAGRRAAHQPGPRARQGRYAGRALLGRVAGKHQRSGTMLQPDTAGSVIMRNGPLGFSAPAASR